MKQKVKRIAYFISLVILCISIIICSGACVSKQDREAAQSVVSKIETIGDVTLNKKEYINEVYNSYNKLTDKQKTLVTNYNVLLNAIDGIEILEIEEEISNDPNRNISRSDLLGIWQSKYDPSSSHYWNVWITQNSIYYMGSKTQDPGFDILKSEYLIATSYSFDGVDKNLRLKKGEFYNSDLHRRFSFTVQIKNDQFVMYISGSPINDWFYKLGQE